jgi:hypothetical protein
MTHVRFHTANALFEAFPELSKKITTAPTDEFPIDYLKKLMSKGDFLEALTFCAYLLPRREAVWWACSCLRDSLKDIPPTRIAILRAAEEWVNTPDNRQRLDALRIGTEADESDPITWVARAAGWSGGLLFSHPQRPEPMPPYMTARAVRIALFLGLSDVKPDERSARLKRWINEGIKLAETGLS